MTLAGGATATVRAADRVSGTATAGARLSVLGAPEVAVEASGAAEVASR